MRTLGPALVLVGPALAFYLVFVLYPIIRGFWISLTEWDGIRDPSFVGVSNYQNLLTDDSAFMTALGNSIAFAFVVVVVKNVVALGLALAIARVVRGVGLYRTGIFLPVTLSFVVAGLIWTWIYDPTFGLLNQALTAAGADFLARGWLSGSESALWAVVFVDLWKWTGLHVLLYLAGILRLPHDVFEAARIDGAKYGQALRYIAIPLLMPVIRLNVLLSLMGAFVKNFEIVYVMTQGGPGRASEVLMTYMYEQLRYPKIGYAAAIGVLLFLVTAAASAVYFRILRSERIEH